MRILAVGVATLDIINIVDAYPHEDDEIRILQQRIQRGGNATNTLVVLSQLGYQCCWAGTLADEPDKSWILDELTRCQIDTRYVRHYAGGKVPTSYILLSKSTGSRTITHYRDLPEYQAKDFREIDTQQFDWIHFEGRNVLQTRQMLSWLKQKDSQRPISLEVEKPRQDIDTLYKYPDILIFSRAFSMNLGYTHPAELFNTVRNMNEQAMLVCAWGEKGAWLQAPNAALVHEPAVGGEVVDTLAAGDVFNAGIIHGSIQGLAPETVLKAAVHLASAKCRQHGLYGFLTQEDGSAEDPSL